MPDGGTVLPPQPLPLTRLPLASSVKNFKPWPPHRCAVFLCAQTLPTVPARAVPGCAGNSFPSSDFRLEAWVQRVSCI